MKAVGYVRVSTSSQAKGDKISLEYQEEKIKWYCGGKDGWEYVDTYRDAGRSGASMDQRDGLKRLLEDAENGKFQVVVAWDITRFGRNLLDLKKNTDFLKQQKIAFVAIDDGIDTSRKSKTGDLLLNLLASIAEFERETIKERTGNTRLKLLREQAVFIGHPPFGYKWDKTLKKLVPHEEEAKIYNRIVDDVLVHAKSLTTIAKALTNEAASTNRRAAHWRHSTLSKILHNETYYTGKVFVEQKIDDDGNTEEFEFECEPLIKSPGRWHEIQECLRNADSRAGRPSDNANHYLLYKRLRCHNGHRLGPHLGTKRVDGSRPRSYACTWHKTTNKNLELLQHDRCSFLAIRSEDIDEYVWNELLRVIKGERYEAFRNADLPERTRSLTEQVAALTKEIQKKKDFRESLDASLAAGLPPAAHAQKYNVATAEIAALEDQLGRARTELINLQEIKIQEQQFLKYRKYFRILFAKHAFRIRTAPFELRQKLVQGMIVGDVVVPEDHDLTKMKIQWRHNLALLRELFPFLPDPDGGGDTGPMTPDKFFQKQRGSQESGPPAGTLNGFLYGDHQGRIGFGVEPSAHRICPRRILPLAIVWEGSGVG